MKYAFLFGILSLMLAQTSFAMELSDIEPSNSMSKLGQQDDFMCPALAESETRDQPKLSQEPAFEVDEVSVRLGAKAI